MRDVWRLLSCSVRTMLLCAVLVVAPWIAHAQNATPDSLASWLFDNYIEQQIEAAAQRSLARDPAVAAAILKSRIALTKSLSRHRAAFETSIKTAIEKNLRSADLIGLDRALGEISAGREGGLTESQRRGLAALDTEFRLNSQSVIRAVAIELESLVAETSKQAAQR